MTKNRDWLLIPLFFMFSTTVLAQDASTVTGSESAEEGGLVQDAVETTEKMWDATKEGSKKAAEYTQEKAGEAWDATKEGTSKAVDWTQEKAEEGWDKTKEVSEKAWDATKEAAKDTGDAVKEGYEVVKDKAKDAVD